VCYSYASGHIGSIRRSLKYLCADTGTIFPWCVGITYFSENDDDSNNNITDINITRSNMMESLQG